MAELPRIDPEAIENLRSLNPGDNDEFLREIIGIFLEDTPQRIAELETGLAAADTPAFARAAHSIKGSSANLGALRLKQIAEKIEHGSRQDGSGSAVADVALLKTEFAATGAELGKFLKP